MTPQKNETGEKAAFDDVLVPRVDRQDNSFWLAGANGAGNRVFEAVCVTILQKWCSLRKKKRRGRADRNAGTADRALVASVSEDGFMKELKMFNLNAYDRMEERLAETWYGLKSGETI